MRAAPTQLVFATQQTQTHILARRIVSPLCSHPFTSLPHDVVELVARQSPDTDDRRWTFPPPRTADYDYAHVFISTDCFSTDIMCTSAYTADYMFC